MTAKVKLQAATRTSKKGGIKYEKQLEKKSVKTVSLEEEEEDDDDTTATSTSNDDYSNSDSYDSDTEKDEEEKQGDSSDESDDLSEEEEDNLATLNRWGKDKSLYYNADTTDLEIGQEFEDAEEEEKVARELQQAMYDKIDESDFMLLDEQKKEKDKSKGKKNAANKEGKEMEQKKGSKSKKGGNGNNDNDDNDTEFMNQNDLMKVDRKQALNMLSKTEKLERLLAESPELLLLVEDMKTKVNELREKIMPLLDMLRKVSD